VSASTHSTSPAAFQLTNVPGLATTVVVLSGSPQATTVGTPFAHPLVALVTDAHQNPVHGVNVTFTAPSHGASAVLGARHALTNPQGVASVPAPTAGSTAGRYVVVASIGRGTPAGFSLTNRAGPASIVTVSGGSRQSTAAGADFALPLTALVTDLLRNRVSGAMVTFTAPASGASGAFHGTRAITVMSNALGLATSPAFTANSTPGGYTVTATLANGRRAAFTLTNTLVLPPLPSPVPAPRPVPGVPPSPIPTPTPTPTPSPTATATPVATPDTAVALASTLRLNHPSTLPGGTATLAGSHCRPGSTVTFHVQGQPAGTTTAGSDGAFRGQVQLPDLPIGEYPVDVACGPVHATVLIDLVVGSAAASGPAAGVTVGAVILFIVLLGAVMLPGASGRPVVRTDDDAD
jgi:hypothetical protein